MTYQEVVWKDKLVWVTGVTSKGGTSHRYVRKFVGRGGVVVREAKNGMLLVQFKSGIQRSFPAGCLSLYADTKWAK